MIDRNWSPPPRPADCEFDYGQGSRSRPASGPNSSAPVTPRSAWMQYCRTASRSVPGRCGARAGRHHVPRSRDRPRLLDFSRGVSALLSSPGNAAWPRVLRFVRLRLGGLSSSFATGDVSFVARGCSAVGSASPCQGEGRGFESRHPLEGASGINPSGGVAEW